MTEEGEKCSARSTEMLPLLQPMSRTCFDVKIVGSRELRERRRGSRTWAPW